MADKATVVQDADKPVPDEVLAQHIVKISDAMKGLLAGPLKEETIVLLIHDCTKIARRDIRAVLRSMASLRAFYVKPTK